VRITDAVSAGYENAAGKFYELFTATTALGLYGVRQIAEMHVPLD
jgi:hypothetical protein